MRNTFKPVDHQHHAQEKLRVCIQTGSMIDFTASFHSKLLECADVPITEALVRYINSLKQGSKDWVLMHNSSFLYKAAKWAEWYVNI